jgi:hypothetical protein
MHNARTENRIRVFNLALPLNYYTAREAKKFRNANSARSRNGSFTSEIAV